jgi:DNA-binding transcriptional regulator YhcF (GntR family)
MSKSTDESKDIFTECKKNTEKFFNEIDKSSPVYHQIATDIQRSYLDAWKNVINSSIALQQELATQTGLNTNMPEKTMNAIQNMIERSINAYQKQNKFVFDSTETSKKIFDVFSENTKIFALLNKNMMELMESGMNKSTQN